MKSILFNFISLIILLQSSLKIAAVGKIEPANDCEVLYDILKEFNAGENDLRFNPKDIGSCCDDRIVVCDPHRGIKRIAELKLRERGYTGFLSDKFTKLVYLNYFSISDNKITGNIPKNIDDLVYLTKFSLRNNSISGEIPESIGNMDGIFHMDFSDNQLSGKLPDSLGNLKQLQFLALRDNKLEGYIPESFRGLTKLSTFELSGNQGLTGYAPLLDSITNCTYANTNLCVKEGAICDNGAQQCTEEDIKRTQENNGFKDFKEEDYGNSNSNSGCNCGSNKGSSNDSSIFKKPLVIIIIIIVIAIVIFSACFIFRGGKSEEEEEMATMKPQLKNPYTSTDYNRNGYYY